jgi:hypothetical protein
VRVLVDHGRLRPDQASPLRTDRGRGAAVQARPNVQHFLVLARLRQLGIASVSELRYVLYGTEGELTVVREPGGAAPDPEPARRRLQKAAAYPPGSPVLKGRRGLVRIVSDSSAAPRVLSPRAMAECERSLRAGPSEGAEVPSGMVQQGRSTPHGAGRAAMPRTLLLAAAVLAAAGCGLTGESAPRAVATETSVADPLPAAPSSTGVVQIYLERGDRLVPVDRAGRTVDDALARLAAGPTPLDSEAGLTSALPQGVVARAARSDSGVVTVDVSAEFAALSGRAQLIGAGQLVWTVTEVCCATRMQVRLYGRAIPLPTDSGLADRPVGRDDYRSVAPE